MLWEHTRRMEDVGKFRVPTLRNIAVTAPYMHNGSIATLNACSTTTRPAEVLRTRTQYRPEAVHAHKALIECEASRSEVRMPSPGFAALPNSEHGEAGR